MTGASRRAGERGMTMVEAAVTFAIVGSLLAVAVPAFVRDLRSSKWVEPVDGVKAIAQAAALHAQKQDVPHAYPPGAPLTPSVVPKGTRAVDPPGVWDHPTWKELGFRAAPEGVAHAYAFAFDSADGALRSSFAAHAHGDLDGDGVTSTFEMRGHVAVPLAPDGGVAGGTPESVIEPGMIVEAEVE